MSAPVVIIGASCQTQSKTYRFPLLSSLAASESGSAQDRETTQLIRPVKAGKRAQLW